MGVVILVIIAIVLVGLIIYTTNNDDYNKETEQQRRVRLQREQQIEEEKQAALQKQREFEQKSERQKQRLFNEQQKRKAEQEELQKQAALERERLIELHNKQQLEQRQARNEEQKRQQEQARLAWEKRIKDEEERKNIAQKQEREAQLKKSAEQQRHKVEQERQRQQAALAEESKRREEKEQQELKRKLAAQKQQLEEAERQKQQKIAEQKRQEQLHLAAGKLAQEQREAAFCEEGTPYCMSIDNLYQRNNRGISLQGIRGISVSAVQLMSEDVKQKLHRELQRGEAVIATEPHLRMYMHAFGNMHQAKLNEAFESLFPHLNTTDSIEVIDYGCGQGVGTICFIDYLKANAINAFHIGRVKLIEPSELALKRAVLNVGYSLASCQQEKSIRAINVGLDGLSDSNLITDKNAIKVHIFSNILDVPDFDIKELCHKIVATQYGLNYFVCVSPNIFADGSHSRNKRLEYFLSFFGVKPFSRKISNIGNWSRYELVFGVDLGQTKKIATLDSNVAPVNQDNDLPF